MEIMSVDKTIWEDHHLRSSFLPNANSEVPGFVALVSSDIVKNPQTPILLQGTDSKGNLCNITQISPIDIVIADFTTPSESHLYGLPLSFCGLLRPLRLFFVL